MSDKLNIAVLCGGQSAEHEVSVRSAINVVKALDHAKYSAVYIYITKNGEWRSVDGFGELADLGERVALLPGCGGRLTNLDNPQDQTKIDVVFPVLHGTNAEDGTIQGLLKLARVPFVGAGVLGSAVGMDKDIMKRLLRDAGLPSARFLAIRSDDKIDYVKVVKELGSPVFVKPANLGSSIGIAKAQDEESFRRAVTNAFRYDRKIIIEEFINGREIECAVLGNETPAVSVPGEVRASHDFYSYEAKYLDDNGATIRIPANIPEDTTRLAREIALKAYQALECAGLARVDLFLREDGLILVNEINTLPGFTSISMYPSLWQASGLKYADLISELIDLALERFDQEAKIITTF